MDRACRLPRATQTRHAIPRTNPSSRSSLDLIPRGAEGPSSPLLLPSSRTLHRRCTRTRDAGDTEVPCSLSRMRAAESGAALASGLVAASALGLQGLDAHEQGQRQGRARQWRAQASLRQSHWQEEQEQDQQQDQAQAWEGAFAGDDQRQAGNSQARTQAQDQALTGTVERSRSVGGEASLSQALIRRTANATVGAAQPLISSRITKGPGGGLMVMAALTLAGVLTVVRATRDRRASAAPEESYVVCADCEGQGMCECSICGGAGSILWEGKLLRNDPCPACLGDGCHQCPTCGVWRRH